MTLSLVIWLLVAPGEDWTWVTVGGPYESAEACETTRAADLQGDQRVCVEKRR